MWAPKLNSETQSTLQILHQKEGTTFGLGHCKIWEGRCGTFTFFLMGYQAVCLCTAEQLKLDCCWGTVLSGANFLLKSSDIESVPTSWNWKYFFTQSKLVMNNFRNQKYLCDAKQWIAHKPNIMVPDSTVLEKKQITDNYKLHNITNLMIWRKLICKMFKIGRWKKQVRSQQPSIF